MDMRDANSSSKTAAAATRLMSGTTSEDLHSQVKGLDLRPRIAYEGSEVSIRHFRSKEMVEFVNDFHFFKHVDRVGLRVVADQEHRARKAISDGRFWALETTQSLAFTESVNASSHSPWFVSHQVNETQLGGSKHPPSTDSPTHRAASQPPRSTTSVCRQALSLPLYTSPMCLEETETVLDREFTHDTTWPSSHAWHTTLDFLRNALGLTIGPTEAEKTISKPNRKIARVFVLYSTSNELKGSSDASAMDRFVSAAYWSRSAPAAFRNVLTGFTLCASTVVIVLRACVRIYVAQFDAGTRATATAPLNQPFVPVNGGHCADDILACAPAQGFKNVEYAMRLWSQHDDHRNLKGEITTYWEAGRTRTGMRRGPGNESAEETTKQGERPALRDLQGTDHQGHQRRPDCPDALLKLGTDPGARYPSSSAHSNLKRSTLAPSRRLPPSSQLPATAWRGVVHNHPVILRKYRACQFDALVA
ncbi:hypothetical protein C8R45DRAFT_944845 [Mycena sanguinolenta]|nr:hypothetical protein C8R45DRAFT_944845 [Mycena sanguinolenta]